MKITVISFDFWGYDAHIVEALKKKGIEAHHIKIGAVGHTNWLQKITNALSKIFLKRNLKHEKRQRFVIEQLQKLGKQDQILVLNCDVFEHETLKKIKNYTDKMLTFLYDNLERYPVEDKLSYFDKIYAFDDQDIEKHRFEKLTNYNYLPFLSQEKQQPKYDVLYITSCDKKRIAQLYALTRKFRALGLRYQIFVLGKKAWKYRIKEIFKKSGIIFKRKLIAHEELPKYYQNTKVIIDLMRAGQYGLSFRVFEAMALEKKIITDNEKIIEYDFYHPNNILVINENFGNIEKDFFNNNYQSPPEEVYRKYTLDCWIEKVFNLD